MDMVTSVPAMSRMSCIICVQMCGEFMQAEMLKRAGAIPGGVSAAGTAQAAMAGSSLPGLVQAGVCVGGVTHLGASHPGSTTGPPDQ